MDSRIEIDAADRIAPQANPLLSVRPKRDLSLDDYTWAAQRAIFANAVFVGRGGSDRPSARE